MKGLCLMIIDVQERLLPKIKEHETLKRRLCCAIQCASLFHIPIIYTEQSPDKLGPTDSSLLHNGLSTATKFTKTAFSALKASGLKDHLKALKVKHVLIAGIETGICVHQTAIDTINAHFKVTILADCIGARRENDDKAVREFLKITGCFLVPTETVFYSILEDAADKRFREFNEIIKQWS